MPFRLAIPISLTRSVRSLKARTTVTVPLSIYLVPSLGRYRDLTLHILVRSGCRHARKKAGHKDQCGLPSGTRRHPQNDLLCDHRLSSTLRRDRGQISASLRHPESCSVAHRLYDIVSVIHPRRSLLVASWFPTARIHCIRQRSSHESTRRTAVRLVMDREADSFGAR